MVIIYSFIIKFRSCAYPESRISRTPGSYPAQSQSVSNIAQVKLKKGRHHTSDDGDVCHHGDALAAC